MRRTLALGAVAFGFAWFAGDLSAQETEESRAGVNLEDLKFRFEVDLENCRAPLEKFDAAYENHLKELSDQFQQQGLLDQFLLVKKEMGSFREGGERDYAGTPKLARLRSIYESNRGEVMEKVIAVRSEVVKRYLQILLVRKKQLTREGKLEAAVAFAEEEKRVVKMLQAEHSTREVASASGPASQETSWQLRSASDYILSGGIVVTKQDGGWLLEKGTGTNTRLGTNRDFRPPFEVIARLTPKADGRVRFIYADRFAAEFNMGSSGDRLLMNHPDGTRAELDGKGRIDAGSVHEIVIKVQPDHLSVFVDRELRGELEADFGGLKAPVAISPHKDCPVLVEKFEVHPLEEESGPKEIARIEAVVGSMERYRKGQRLFTDKPVDLEDVPSVFEGLRFVLTSKNGGSARILEPGTVYVVTAAPGTPNDREEELVAAGFKKKRIPPFQLYGTHSWDQARVFSKSVAAGETVSVGKYGIIVGR